MDTGRAGAIGGRSLDDLLDLSYFAAQGLLPKKRLLSALDTFPARDFEFLDSNVVAVSKGLYKFTGGGGPIACLGWDLGASYEKVLAVWGMSRLGGANYLDTVLWDALPTNAAGASANGYVLHQDPTNTRYQLDGLAGFGSPLVTVTVPRPPIQYSGASLAVAMYYDKNAAELKVFVRFGGERWFQITELTESGISSIRAVGWFVQWATPHVFEIATPFGCWGE